jgi:hypothetical protein
MSETPGTPSSPGNAVIVGNAGNAVIAENAGNGW